MSRLSSKEAFSLRCVLSMLVEMIKQDTHLSLWICSPLHYSVLHFYVTSSSLIMVKSFRVDKSRRLQAETRIFQLPLLSSCKHQSEAQCLFCFCYHSCIKKKMYIKGLFADLQWLGEDKELSEGIQKEEKQSSVLSHGKCFSQSSVFCMHLSPWWFQVSSQSPPTSTYA